MFKPKKFFAALMIFFAATLSGCGNEEISEPKEFLNVSYDPTRELYAEYNEKFLEHWTNDLGNEKIILEQSHGGSGKQSRAVINGQTCYVGRKCLGYVLISLTKSSAIMVAPQGDERIVLSLYTSGKRETKNEDK